MENFDFCREDATYLEKMYILLNNILIMVPIPDICNQAGCSERRRFRYVFSEM